MKEFVPHFKNPVETLGKKSKESEVKKFVTPEGEDSKYPIVKEIDLETPKENRLDPEESKRSYELMKEYGLADFLPDTEFVVGKNNADRKTLYVLQEEIKGETIAEIGLKNIKDPEILKQLAELFEKSLLMLKTTLHKKVSFPRAIPEDFTDTKRIIDVNKDDGVMPEIFNLNNIMIGRRQENDKDRVYFVDNHSLVVITPDHIKDPKYGGDYLLLDWLKIYLTPLFEAKKENQLFKIYLDIFENL